MSGASRLSRRDVLLLSLTAAGTLTLAQTVKGNVVEQQTIPPRPPALKPDLVKEFVQVAHGDLDRTKALLAQEPALLNAAWDWGGGDFEMAIGGAGHMGRRDIAQFLIEKGSRMDIFVAAMLGELEIVQATLRAFPNLSASHGPHGIPLIAHAKAGGREAKAVLDYLQALRADKTGL